MCLSGTIIYMQWSTGSEYIDHDLTQNTDINSVKPLNIKIKIAQTDASRIRTKSDS